MCDTRHLSEGLGRDPACDLPFPVATRLLWHKRRWRCQHPACPRSSFTESVPQIPSRKRVTSRLRSAAGRAVALAGRTVAQAAVDCDLALAENPVRAGQMLYMVTSAPSTHG
jgi:hypothetical protein